MDGWVCEGRVSNQALVPIILTLRALVLRPCSSALLTQLLPCEAIEIQLLTFDRLAAFIRVIELLLQQHWARVESLLAWLACAAAAAIAAMALPPRRRVLPPRETWVFCGVCLWGEITIHISIILPIIWSLVPYNGRTLCTLASAVQCDARYV